MNAKEQIIKLLKEQLDQLEMQMPRKHRQVHKLKKLITTTEQAIFDVPSEEEIRQAAQQIGLKAIAFPTAQALAFIDGCNFIINYKTEQDGK